MRACLAHRVLAVTAIAAQLGLAGCQGAAPRPGSSWSQPDFASLVSMAGSTAPAATARAQKGDAKAQSGILELGYRETPGAENASRIRAVVNGDAILEEELLAMALPQLQEARTEKQKQEILKA